jgi:hypothetical protein
VRPIGGALEVKLVRNRQKVLQASEVDLRVIIGRLLATSRSLSGPCRGIPGLGRDLEHTAPDEVIDLGAVQAE